jgi:hypothetical protein
VISFIDVVVWLTNKAVAPVVDVLERGYARWLAGIRADEHDLGEAVHHALAASRRARAGRVCS